MKFLKATVVAVIAVVALGAAAQAGQYGSRDCFKAEHAVNDAMQANASSPNMDAAKDERRSGVMYCHSSFYDQGVAHLNHAVALLTGQQQASN